MCPNLDRHRGQIETAFGAIGVPFAIEGRIRIGRTAFGKALFALLRFEWLGGDRHDLYGFLRSPFSGLTRAHVDYLEGRLRGRAINDPVRVVDETVKLRGQPLRVLDIFREEGDLPKAVRGLARSMVRAAYGLEAPPVSEEAILDLRAEKAVAELLDELEAWIDSRRRAHPRGDLHGARAVGAPPGPRRRARPGRSHRPAARSDAANRRRVPARPGGRQPPPPLAGVAFHRGRGAPLDRRALPASAPGQAGFGLAGALLLLHRLHTPIPASLPRP